MIFINGYFLTEKNKSGVSRFALQTLIALDNLIVNEPVIKQSFIILITHCNLDYQFINIEIKKIGFFRNKYLWEQIDLPLEVGSKFLINLANFAPVYKKNQICTIHDTLIFCYPQAYSRKFGVLTRFIHRMIISHTNIIATVSEFSANEIKKYIGKPKNEIVIFNNSAEHLLQNKSNAPEINNLSPGQYILSIFSQKNSFYKNISNYLLAIKNIDYKFICVGNIELEGITVPDNLLQLGFVSDSQLKWLLENAFALLCPSLYEGFGIPLLEAMVCACPVLASDIPVFHEVCRNAAIYFNPNEPIDIKQKINYLIQNPEMRMSIIKNGYLVSAAYAWKNNAEILYKIMKTI